MKKFLATIILFIIIFSGISLFSGMCSSGTKVVQKEFSPEALLSKYEYFKNISAAIDKKRADINMYQEEISTMSVEDKDDKFYLQQRKSELLGIISIHNELCAEYNAQMSKFNYRFTNVGDLPQGATVPLPREFKPYINNLKKQ
jgi:hypothetical protein